MKSNEPCFADASRGSVLLTLSTSSYFGGTGVAAYVTSKHGALGLLRASQSTAEEIGVRVNAVAPFFTPTQITASFSEDWKAAGLKAYTPENVARAIVQMAMDPRAYGNCCLVRTIAIS